MLNREWFFHIFQDNLPKEPQTFDGGRALAGCQGLGLTVASRDSKVCNCIKDLIVTYFAGIIASTTKQPK